MVLPTRNFERKEEYINDSDWSEEEVFEDTFFNTIFGQRSKTKKKNLSLHQKIGELKFETEAVKEQFEIKRYAMQNNTQIIAIYLSCLKTISEGQFIATGKPFDSKRVFSPFTKIVIKKNCFQEIRSFLNIIGVNEENLGLKED